MVSPGQMAMASITPAVNQDRHFLTINCQANSQVCHRSVCLINNAQLGSRVSLVTTHQLGLQANNQVVCQACMKGIPHHE